MFTVTKVVVNSTLLVLVNGLLLLIKLRKMTKERRDKSADNVEVNSSKDPPFVGSSFMELLSKLEEVNTWKKETELSNKKNMDELNKRIAELENQVYEHESKELRDKIMRGK